MALSEAKIQKKILDYLTIKGFYAVKVVNATRGGIPDILACSPKGKFVAIEVKTENGVLSELQRININKILEVHGNAFVAYGYEDFLAKISRFLGVMNDT